MKIGLVGLGKMGSNMVLRLLKDKHEIVVYDRSPDPVKSLEKQGAIGAGSVPDLLKKLPKQKVIWIMVPSGDPTIQTIREISTQLSKGDIVIDGGNSYYKLEEMRMLIANPTASLYNNRTQIVAALEFACLDILGQAWGVPVSEILGGRLRDRIPFAAYCFFRYPDTRTGSGEVRTIDQVVENACLLKAQFGFTTLKIKGGVFHPDYELEAYRAVAAALPGDSLRFDPNGVWSTEQAVRFGQAIEDLRNDYLEDPVFGLNGMRRTRQMVRVPLATNTVVVNFEQLATNILDLAVDVILLDTTFWGGIRPCVKAAGVCETFQLGVAVHSSGELGIQLATMLHLGAVIPNLSFAADAHYHHLRDDIIEGGPFQYEGGAIRVPISPGLGVRLNREKLREYAELYQRLGGYPYDQDPGRPGWTPLIPNDRWADPKDTRPVKIPF